jgi:hypothetical protein
MVDERHHDDLWFWLCSGLMPLKLVLVVGVVVVVMKMMKVVMIVMVEVLSELWLLLMMMMGDGRPTAICASFWLCSAHTDIT